MVREDVKRLGAAASPLTTIEPPCDLLTDDDRLLLLEALPAAVLLIDGEAIVRFANRSASDMLGLDRAAIHGRGVLDFVLPDDVEFAAQLLVAGTNYAGLTMGPSRLRYVASNGDAHWTQVWASTTPSDLGVDGFILTLTSESVRDVLATAVSSLATHDELDGTLAAVQMSARAMPLCGRGAILVAERAHDTDATTLRSIGDWPLGEAAIDAAGSPWREALVDGTNADVDDVATAVSLAPALRDVLLAAGVTSLFVRLITDDSGAAVGVYVVFRDDTGPASMNQAEHLNDAVSLAALAFAQSNRRAELETAARRDALTGVPNRAAFIERVEGERRAVDVLFVDLDRFKEVNDTFGHQIGDMVVVDAARRIVAAVRREDVVYRIGGDEFVVVCEAMVDDAERAVMAERLVAELMLPFDVGEHQVNISATVGIACGGGRTLGATVHAADSALYDAKALGRAGWVHAPPVA